MGGRAYLPVLPIAHILGLLLRQGLYRRQQSRPQRGDCARGHDPRGVGGGVRRCPQKTWSETFRRPSRQNSGCHEREDSQPRQVPRQRIALSVRRQAGEAGVHTKVRNNADHRQIVSGGGGGCGAAHRGDIFFACHEVRGVGKRGRGPRPRAARGGLVSRSAGLFQDRAGHSTRQVRLRACGGVVAVCAAGGGEAGLRHDRRRRRVRGGRDLLPHVDSGQSRSGRAGGDQDRSGAGRDSHHRRRRPRHLVLCHGGWQRLRHNRSASRGVCRAGPSAAEERVLWRGEGVLSYGG
mmetsp:Transcript_88343/g.254759  ORF Transcript_88343/g.254759 Transcript_88343/m.254759 type:complete len:293 (-) Transcript_88343:480-1358(-)